MKTHPENVINRIVKNVWASHTGEDTLCISAEHTLASPSDMTFFCEADEIRQTFLKWPEQIKGSLEPELGPVIHHCHIMAFMLQTSTQSELDGSCCAMYNIQAHARCMERALLDGCACTALHGLPSIPASKHTPRSDYTKQASRVCPLYPASLFVLKGKKCVSPGPVRAHTDSK